jgi:hypothetical protein
MSSCHCIYCRDQSSTLDYRRNTDKEIRHLERDYAMSGDRETWQRLQRIKDRTRISCHRCSTQVDETISFRKHEYCKPCYQEGVIEDDGMPCDGYESDCGYEMAYDWQDRDTGEYIMCQRCYQQALDNAAHEIRVNNEFSHYDDYDYKRYRRNTDDHLRDLERRAATEGWNAKLNLNVAAVLRYGLIPAPDVEIKASWDPYYFKEIQSCIARCESPLWQPTISDYQSWYRRWYFPNGFGVAATYNAYNPIPGLAPDPAKIPPEDHELEAIAFRWAEEDGGPKPFVGIEHYYGRLLRKQREGHIERVDILAHPSHGAPEHQFLGMVTPRFRLTDQDAMLEVLQIVARAKLGASSEEIWNGTGWDWWNDDDD